MCFIFDFDLQEVDKILQNIRNNNSVLIQETYHFKKQAEIYKYCSYELTYELLQNNIPHDIEYSEDNKFKIRYLNPDNEKYYTCVVIFIIDKEKIRIITTHPERRKKIMILKKQLDYRYDSLADALFIYVVDSSDYEEAIEIASNTYLSLDEDNYPVALEILDASKVLDVQKFNLKNIKRINLKMCINDEKIIVDCVLEVPVHNKNQIKSTNSVIVNDLDLPSITAELATA